MEKQVLQNLAEVIKNKDFFTDVNIDHVVTDEEREKIILRFDNLRKKPLNRIKNIVAEMVFKKVAHRENTTTEITGAENLTALGDTGAIITSNHFHPLDCFIIRYACDKTIKRKIYFVVKEHNVFIPGQLGRLIRNANIMPISASINYTKNNFEVAVEKILRRKQLVTIYPEQSMWTNYTKPRPTKPGAYHYAVKHNVPIIPLFITMGFDENKAVKYTVHILPLLFPNKELDFQAAKQTLQEDDYNARVKLYEELYNKKLTYDYEEGDIFNPDEDIFARMT